jgi:MscS family membrane protein
MLYRQMHLSWVERLMPEPWREFLLLGLPLWQWVVLLVAIPLVLAVAGALHRLLLKVLRPLLARLTRQRADAQLTRVAAPLRLLIGAVAVAIWASVSALPLLTRAFLTRLAVAVAIVGLAWLLFRLVDIIAETTDTHFRSPTRSGGSPSSSSPGGSARWRWSCCRPSPCSRSRPST